MKNTNIVAQQAGFTLVEIALAMLVLAVGLVVLLGIFPAGLAVNKRSIDETRAAIFAEEVLNAVKAAAAETPWSQITSKDIIPPAKDIWKDSTTLSIVPNSGKRTSRYINIARDPNNKVETAVMKYQLEIKDSVDGRRKLVTLQVVNGEYAKLEDGRVYYTELFYNGL